MLGHSSITVTLDGYGHLFPSLSEQVANRVDEVARAAQLVARSRHESDTTVTEIGRSAGRPPLLTCGFSRRAGRIRTADLLTPSQAR
jgi:hypothetical protein